MTDEEKVAKVTHALSGGFQVGQHVAIKPGFNRSGWNGYVERLDLKSPFGSIAIVRFTDGVVDVWNVDWLEPIY